MDTIEGDRHDGHDRGSSATGFSSGGVNPFGKYDLVNGGSAEVPWTEPAAGMGRRLGKAAYPV